MIKNVFYRLAAPNQAPQSTPASPVAAGLNRWATSSEVEPGRVVWTML